MMMFVVAERTNSVKHTHTYRERGTQREKHRESDTERERKRERVIQREREREAEIRT
jgi:hypothetical protein